MPDKHQPVREPLFEQLFRDLMSGSAHAPQEDGVRKYIGHRLGNGAHLEEVLEEEYVRRNCSEEEVNTIIMDPRLIHEDRESLRRLFESGDLDPTSTARPRRRPQ